MVNNVKLFFKLRFDQVVTTCKYGQNNLVRLIIYKDSYLSALAEANSLILSISFSCCFSSLWRLLLSLPISFCFASFWRCKARNVILKICLLFFHENGFFLVSFREQELNLYFSAWLKSVWFVHDSALTSTLVLVPSSSSVQTVR